MGFVLQNTWIEIFLFLTFITFLILNFFHNAYTYWTRKGVPTITPKFPLGNTNTILPKGFSVGTLSKNFYDDFKKQGAKFGGVYLMTEPNLVLVDPDVIKEVISVNFQNFVDRGLYYNKKTDPLSAHLFALDGSDWRNLRVKLTPTFTSGKMKMMFDAVKQCSGYMGEFIGNNLDSDLDTKEILSRFTTDVIGSCAFGIQCNSFKYPDAEFRMYGKKIFEYNLLRSLRAFCLLNMPKLSLKLGFWATTEELWTFFQKVVKDTIKMRESGVRRNDFFQILMDLKSANFTFEEMVAQVFVFFIAGFDTSSTAMTFALYELARNQEIQEKVRAEICEVLEQHDNELTYESLKEMKYLDQVFQETLRMYPPLTTLNRRCTKDFTLPDTDIVIEKGTPILISTLGLHNDPDYFPDPEVFDPERFSEERKDKIRSFTYLPFGDGPRNCIGLRFGTMNSKIGILSVIKDFRLSVSPANKKVEFNPYTFLLHAKDKVLLRAEKV